MTREEITLRPEVKWFAQQMELMLRENDNKGGWDEESREFLLSRLQSNTSSVYAALQCYGACFDAENVIRKAANVANFAMMIADNANGGDPWKR